MTNIYEKVKQDLNNFYSNNDNNIWRNKNHIEMPFGLVNDPNGLSYFNGKYHIFYQWNPFGCEHKTKHWALVKTTDFVNFTKPEIILKPEDWFDKNGCYSGGAYVKDDILKLFYTGNVKNEKDERESYQCIVDYNKDGSFEKRGPIIPKQPDGYTAHFRDPMIFVNEGIYYMVLGVQRENLTGAALIYKSDDIEKWELVGELETDMKEFGYMWECPNIIKVNDDKYAFLFSPQGLEAEEFKNQNIYQSGYVIGNLDFKVPQLKNHSEFKEIDMGFDFYAPQVFTHNDKNIMIGWVGMPDKDSEYPSGENGGWMFPLTLPRVLEYKDNVLYQKPLKEVENLREKQIVSVKDLNINEYSLDLDSRNIEIDLELLLEECTFIDFKFIFRDEYINLTYNKENGVCIIDRNNMKLGGKGIRKFKLNVDKTLKLHMFIDNSVMEIYYQEGLETTTLMYFPKFDDFKIEIKSDNKVKMSELNIWNLRGIKYE
ncbi:sucrose-6-phosphate hydrolase [Clostridium butyricum]|uniref:Sucrose-6-phosphate hydrolase n=2 Tax=Clostridium butyricum TaxID=1492 RepID=C4IN22_CLOBU|nr:sucrose-6-phosphate hydrolase [Clostridium butyricum]APF21879.1 sucrose-6-phosphate hydrolase family protein [Clostridium butyricum]EDT74992.1 sucrose-6-phosphate hydrolase [Clostridium butyricum 5521]EEP52349.1 sucrose-6-phosphate hydrolase (Sucrase) (Invertase) [Clostridium butyricum E4 str. BoNT E BL5262]MBZ5747621.1 sucrose-6-phosphate hydrolase [Clostridium butyricum]MDU6038347.1 sucrose-6-phosphate hydrolase [Clostridium butyricum]